MADWSDGSSTSAFNTAPITKNGSTGRLEVQRARLNEVFDDMCRDYEGLQERIKALESEVTVWKMGYHKSKNENEDLHREVERLKHTVDSLRRAGLLDDDTKSVISQPRSLVMPVASPPPSFSPPGLSPQSPQNKRTPAKRRSDEFEAPSWGLIDTPETSPEPSRRVNVKKIDNSKPIYQQTPHLCAFHYLSSPSGCKNGDSCERAHDYVLTSEQLAQFREELKQIPCPMLYKHAKCYNKRCFWKHQCSAGSATSCPRLISGKVCNFDHDSD